MPARPPAAAAYRAKTHEQDCPSRELNRCAPAIPSPTSAAAPSYTSAHTGEGSPARRVRRKSRYRGPRSRSDAEPPCHAASFQEFESRLSPVLKTPPESAAVWSSPPRCGRSVRGNGPRELEKKCRGVPGNRRRISKRRRNQRRRRLFFSFAGDLDAGCEEPAAAVAGTCAR